MNVGIVNINRLLDSSKRGKALSVELKTIGERWESEIASADARLGSAAKRLRGLGSSASPEVSFELQRDGRLAEMELASLRERMRFEIEVTRDHFRGLLMAELEPLLKAIAEERGLSVLLTEAAGAVAYADEALDLTDELCRRFDTSAA